MSQSPLPDKELHAIRQRCLAACREPLAVVNLGNSRAAICYSSEAGGADKAVPLAKYYGDDRLANAVLAAHAREDILKLLAEVDRLREALRQSGAASVS